MKIKLNASSPTRIEVLLNPEDELVVSPELGARLLAASPNLREQKPKRKPRPKPAAKPTGKGARK